MLTALGICGAALLGAMRIAMQQDWIAVDDPLAMSASAVGAGLVGTTLVDEWNTALCLLVVVWGAASLYGLGRSLTAAR